MRMREALGITKKDGARYDAMEAHFHGYIFDKEHWQRTFGPVKKASYGVQSLLDNLHELETYAMAAADARQEAETARQEEETALQDAETSRQEAETAGEEAENARQQAETARQVSRLKIMGLSTVREQIGL